MKEYVETSIGTWCVAEDKGNGQKPLHYMAIVRDVDAFSQRLFLLTEKINAQKYEGNLDELIELIEFGEIKVSKSGFIKWQCGNFVEKSDSNGGLKD